MLSRSVLYFVTLFRVYVSGEDLVWEGDGVF